MKPRRPLPSPARCAWVLLAVTACAVAPEPTAHLAARPHEPTSPLASGRHAWRNAGPDAFVYVPAQQSGTVLVLLHGATRALPDLAPFQAAADARGIVLAVPSAREHTWDLMAAGEYGADVTMLDAALAELFNGVRAERIALAGFSDGASYALSVGLQNAELFTHVIAFSPGYIGPGAATGRPKTFISHGRFDRILPIEATSRLIVPVLDRAGIGPTYHEFDGGHEVPPAILAAALDWLMR